MAVGNIMGKYAEMLGETIEPQAGVGGGTPAPKKLRVDSTRITTPTCNVASTIRVLVTPGRI